MCSDTKSFPPRTPSCCPLESWNQKSPEYSRLLTDYIQTQNRTRIAETLRTLEHELYQTSAEIPELKRYLIDIYLQIKQNLTHNYSNMEIAFSSNASIIDFIEKKYYLYEILQYFSEHFEMCMNAIGSPTSKTIIDDILYYINHNYRENLKLETIAPPVRVQQLLSGENLYPRSGRNLQFLPGPHTDPALKRAASGPVAEGL